MNPPVIAEIFGKVSIYEPQLGAIQKAAREKARLKARNAKRISDIKQLQTAFEIYFNDRNRYPAGSQVIMGSGGARCLDENGFGLDPRACGRLIYMNLIPQNPAPGGSEYIYSRLNDTSYSLEFSLEGDGGGLRSGAQCATENSVESKPCTAVERSPSSQPGIHR